MPHGASSAKNFHQQGLLTDMDIASLSETQVEPVFQAWEVLPSEARAKVEETEVIQADGLKEHHWTECDALGVDRWWYQW